ncbi:hypothetical protein B0T26DRAFT_654454 [Lasiosphaeria miniovina]|uniref:Zn(2)-C6 fungal-type domain-containing protein n=1 Tax=Lasiosphaeria miniovina TaxID=1954250 RepID=A0AA40A5X1_9PEZI|nr:uncharacterized protein B0T26DRAFT_654454 [Lasiosphaeria miniovina]KAK0709800.1 hypothetical protein B0T26DRAFT_654454 [Lasiosphaeria miniovina]
MDEKREAAEAEDVLMQQQSYPSPTVDGSDPQYYHIPAQREHEQEMGHQVDQTEHHGLPALQGHQAHQGHQEQPEQLEQHVQHEHHDLHELQELQDVSSPDLHHSRPSVSVEELQLAAQLTQGLAPMMAAAQNHVQEPDMSHEGHGGQDQEEPNLQEQLQAELQNHDHELQNVMPHDEQQSQAHPLYVQQQHPPPPPLPQHIPMDHLGHQQYQLQDSTPPRKRSKVSRACDECRRKKIKCDAQSEATEQPCSNCRRSNANCLFSRVPQKRGPSKGYIKELADRLNTIEGKLGASSREGLEAALNRASGDAFQFPMPGDESRKRPFASISNDGFPSPTPDQTPSGAPENKPIRPYIPPNYRRSYSVNDLAPRLPKTPELPEDNDGALQPPPDTALMDRISDDFMTANGLPQDGLPQVQPLHLDDEVRDIEDSVFECYLSVIHPIFPFLASTKERVRLVLSQCPPILQNAFCSALLAMLKPYLPASTSQVNEMYPSAGRLLSDWELGPRTRSKAVNLLHFQTLLTMIIETDNQGVGAAKGLMDGPPKSAILGKAIGLGFWMKLHRCVPEPVPDPELDLDSDENVGLRAWWTLIALDRWNGLGTATPGFIDNGAVIIQPGLKHIVGETVYILTRLAYIIGQLTRDAIDTPTNLGPETYRARMRMTDMIMDDVRTQFPFSSTESDQPILHLAYWHTRLLSDILLGPLGLDSVLKDCQHIVHILTTNIRLQSPLNHHFISLATLTLLELVKDKYCHEEAAKVVKHILDFGIAPSPWNYAVREKITENSRLLTDSEPPSFNLQHLANLAAAVDAPVSPTTTAAVSNSVNGPSIVDASQLRVADPSTAFKQDETDNVGAAGNHVISGESQDIYDPGSFLREGYLTCFHEAF